VAGSFIIFLRYFGTLPKRTHLVRWLRDNDTCKHSTSRPIQAVSNHRNWRF